MDLNNKIIQGVRQFPCLYDNKRNFNERNRAWMQLADRLKVNEIYLKIRWHSLVQGYHRNINFKYANAMGFLQRNIETHTEADSWPEFVITVEDLKDDRREQDREEFVFLELDEEVNKIKNLPQKSAKKNECHKVTTKQLENIPSDEFKNKNEEKTESKMIAQTIKSPNNKCVTQNESVKEMATDKSEVIGITTSKVSERMAAIDVNKLDEPCIKESKAATVEKSNTLATERCEDIIFGELVSAMLKRMDENKKNNIKKEIMNLLFS